MLRKIKSFFFKPHQTQNIPAERSVVDYFFPNRFLALPEGCEAYLRRQICDIQNAAHLGSGLYYEFYEPRVLNGFRKLDANLSGYEKVVFQKLLAEERWDISDEAYTISREAEAGVWKEIHTDCI